MSRDTLQFYGKLTVSTLIELGPVLVFFVVYKYTEMLSAIAVVMAMTVLSVVIGQLLQKRVALFPIISGGFTIIFGLLSLYYQNPKFYIIQHTLFYWLWTVLLTIGLFQGKSYLKPLIDSIFAISDTGWMISAFRYAWVYGLLGLGNELSWRIWGEEFWVYYKLMTPIPFLIFSYYQFQLCKRERLPEATKWGFRR